MYVCTYVHGGAKVKHMCMFNEGFFALRVCGAYIWRAYFRNFAVFCQKNFENSELKQKFQL